MTPTNLRFLSLSAAIGSAALGGFGLLAGFMYLSMASPQDVMAGQAGIVAGAILLSAGVIALAILSPRANHEGSKT